MKWFLKEEIHKGGMTKIVHYSLPFGWIDGSFPGQEPT